MPKIRAFRLLVASAAFWVTVSLIRADDGLRDDPSKIQDSRMYHDPELPWSTVVRVHPENLLSLWLVALKRPEADYQCQAALAIALAHKEGVKGLEAAIDPLLEALKPPGQATEDLGDASLGSWPRSLVRLSSAHALIELDARQAAPQLWREAQIGDHHMRELIEPALVRWNYQSPRSVWLERLRRPNMKSGDLLLAVRGLAALREKDAALPLKDLVHSDQASWSMRQEAAQALGRIQTSGLEPDARQFLASGVNQNLGDRDAPSASARLTAAWLLRHHQAEEAVRLLQALARDSEPAVAVIAIERLLEIDSKLVLPAMDSALASPDARVRLLGVETLFREPNTERIRLLADKLDDEHPDVRLKARQVLFELASKSPFRNAVIQEGSRMLAGQNWRGLEQATILLVQLDHKPVAERLVQLLTFERPEVFVAAGWGLRRLDVSETLPAVFEHFRSFRGLSESNATSAKLEKMPPIARDHQFSYLAQFMGQRRYSPAEPTLRLFVPRVVRSALVGQETRAAAIWALGLILEGKTVPGLVEQLEQRLNDIPKGMDPGEDPRVRRMSAITLARLKANDTLKSLRRYYLPKPNLDPVSPACGWAIQQLTGEPQAAPGIVELPAPAFKNWLRPIPETKPKG